MKDRAQRDRATRALLLSIAIKAREAEHAIWEAEAYESGEKWGDPTSRQDVDKAVGELRLMVSRINAAYGPAPVRVVPADAVVDVSDEAIDEAARFAALFEPAPDDDTEDYIPIRGHITKQATAWGRFPVTEGGAA